MTKTSRWILDIGHLVFFRDSDLGIVDFKNPAMHVPVLLHEVLETFNPKPGGVFIDATVNGGGHARAIAERVGERGKVLGIDWDCGIIRESRVTNHESGIENIELICGNYADIQEIARKQGVKKANGILFDLGFSSYHIEKSGRGFTFLRDEPLDMRYSASGPLTAEKIINHDSREAIENIIRTYGGERYAGRIASALVRARGHGRIKTSRGLADIIWRAVPVRYRRAKIHPATRTFQALRIAVNRELDNVEQGLRNSLPVLASGGAIIAISFHSLEDGIVKRFFQEQSAEGALEIITSKPVRASGEEQKINPASRSARLRAARRTLLP